ncbi:MAG: HesA/MoeB/ThiF family protein [Bacillota bacterium]
MELTCLIGERAQGSIVFKDEVYRGLSLAAVREIAALCICSLKEVEIAALEMGVIPERYERSLGTVGGPAGQVRLLRSRAAVIGLGGLGGLTAELLTRMGVGTIVLVDGDSFNESNLNRQVMSTETNLGQPKVTAATARLAEINAAVELIAYPSFATPHNLEKMLAGCHVALDCLDSLGARFLLQDFCRRLQIPFVHGAIAQYYGQLSVIYPGDPGLEAVYGPTDVERDRGIEKELGNPATTPALVASLQAQEALKILLGTGELLRGRLLFIDTLQGVFESVQLEKGVNHSGSGEN